MRHGKLVVGHDQKSRLCFLGHILQQSTKPLDIGVIQRRIDLIENAERCGLAAEGSKNKRQRRQCLLTTREKRQGRELLAGRLGKDLQSGLEWVIAADQPQMRLPTVEHAAEQRLEVSVNLDKNRLKPLAPLFFQHIDRAAQTTDGRSQFFMFAHQMIGLAARLAIFFLRQKIDGAEGLALFLATVQTPLECGFALLCKRQIEVLRSSGVPALGKFFELATGLCEAFLQADGVFACRGAALLCFSARFSQCLKSCFNPGERGSRAGKCLLGRFQSADTPLRCSLQPGSIGLALRAFRLALSDAGIQADQIVLKRRDLRVALAQTQGNLGFFLLCAVQSGFCVAESLMMPCGRLTMGGFLRLRMLERLLKGSQIGTGARFCCRAWVWARVFWTESC